MRDHCHVTGKFRGAAHFSCNANFKLSKKVPVIFHISLVKNLMDEDFKYLSEEFTSKYLELVKEKEVYPYEYMKSLKKLSEDKLLDKCKFFSSLKDECVNEKDYERAKNVWNAFKMKTMGDYNDLYLKTDVLLLAGVFEKFIKTCLYYYGLDPCHYFSSPG